MKQILCSHVADAVNACKGSQIQLEALNKAVLKFRLQVRIYSQNFNKLVN